MVDLNQIIVSLVAILSLVWSAITFYLTYLRRGKLVVVYPKLVGFSKIRKRNCAIAIPLVFINRGARLGIVEDMKLVVSCQNKQNSFIWQTELDAIPPTPTKKAPLATPFSIKGQSSIVKLCGFVSELEFSFRKGSYTCKLMVKHDGKWSECMIFKFELDRNDISIVETGNMLIQLAERLTPITTHEVRL